MTWREVVYEYDGSFDGLLCCIYESYTQKQLPAAFFRTGELEPCLYEGRCCSAFPMKRTIPCCALCGS